MDVIDINLQNMEADAATADINIQHTMGGITWDKAS
jgi:hypothetical protein